MNGRTVAAVSRRGDGAEGARLRGRLTILIISMLLLGGLVAGIMQLPSRSNAAWQSGGGFDANIRLEYTPTNPSELQAVNVTAYSFLGQTVYDAVLYVWYTLPTDGTQRYGGYQMEKLNSTFRYHQIDGYMAGTEVEFMVTVSDGNNKLESQRYSYTVQATQSWKYSDFAQNLDLSWGPSQPRWDENVSVQVDSRDLDVLVFRADLEITVEFPGMVAQSSTISMIDRDGSKYVYSTYVPVYPGGTRVTFTVSAYDMFYTPMVSPPISYIVSQPPEVFIYNAYVIVFDNGTQDYVDTSVTISNSTWSLTGHSTNGIFWSPTVLTPGDYRVDVVTKEGNRSMSIYVPEPSSNNSYWFYINEAQDISTGFSDQAGPGWLEVVSIGIVSLLIPVFVVAGHLIRKQRVSHANSKILGRKKIRGQMSPEKGLLNRLKKNVWGDSERKQSITTAGAFLLLGAAATTFAPFYPWWLMILITLTITALAYRFPYLSLILISFVVIASTAYQKPEFGWLFMVFALGVSIASLFDWRFGYLTYLTVFLAGYGLGFLVPVAAALMFPLFLAVTVTLVAGLFLTLLITTGNFTWLSFFTFSHRDMSVTTFSRSAPSSFGPDDVIRAVASIRHINLDALGQVLTSNMSSVLPLIIVLMWCVMVLLVFLLRTRARDKKWTAFAVGGVALLFTAVPPMIMMWLAFDHSFTLMNDLPLYLLSVGVFPAAMSVYFAHTLAREGYSEYYGKKESNVNIGTKISEMMSFRRTSFDMVGGLTEVKGELKNTMIGPLLRPGVAKQYGVEPPRGIIMFGPPGCGKTLLMRTIASELDVEMIGVKCSDVMSKWYGESENLLNTLFQVANEKKPCILFLDEIDAIAKRRDFYSADDVTPRLLSIMLSEMDGMDDAAGIIIIGATNKPELIDPALMRPGRFDKVIYVPPPDTISRKDILRIHLKDKPTASDINIDRIAELTRGYSGADLANLVREAASAAMRRSIKTKKRTRLTMTDLESIASVLKPSLTEKMTREYDDLRQEYERKSKDRDGEAKDAGVRLSDLGGLGKLREHLEHLGRIMSSADLSSGLGIHARRGLFLFGPPGTGKATAIEAMAAQYRIPLHRFPARRVRKDLSSAGGMERLKERSRGAIASQPGVLLFEDVDSFTGERALSDSSYRSNYEELLSIIDSVPKRARILMAATSGRPDRVDPSFVTRSRFPSMVHMGLPDLEARDEILQHLVIDACGPGGMDTMLVAMRTEGFNARDLRTLVDEAKLAIVEKRGHGLPPGVSDSDIGIPGRMGMDTAPELFLMSEDLLDALEKVSITTEASYLKACEAFAERITEENDWSPDMDREEETPLPRKRGKKKAGKVTRAGKRGKAARAGKRGSATSSTVINDDDFMNVDDDEPGADLEWD